MKIKDHFEAYAGDTVSFVADGRTKTSVVNKPFRFNGMPMVSLAHRDGWSVDIPQANVRVEARKEFHVGDLVTGNDVYCYSITNSNALCVVTHIDDEDNMYVRLLATTQSELRRIDFGGTYNVVPSHFVFVRPEDFFIREHAGETLYACVGAIPRPFAASSVLCAYAYDKSREVIEAAGGILIEREIDVDFDANVAAPDEIQLPMCFMDKVEPYVVPDDVKTRIKGECTNLLNWCGCNYNPADAGMQIIIDTSTRSKAKLMGLLSRDPRWNPDKLQIQFTADIERGIDKEAVSGFCDWVCAHLTDVYAKREIKICGMTLEEAKKAQRRTSKICIRFKRLKGLGISAVEYGTGNDLRYYEAEEKKLDNIVACFNTDYVIDCPDREDIVVSSDDYRQYNALFVLFSLISDVDGPLATESFAAKVNELRGTKDFEIYKDHDIAQEGQKVSKVVRKIARAIGLDKIVDVQTETFTDQNGEVHSRTKDKGWNYQYAMFCDAINPIKVKRHTIISLNPYDYYTASFGHKWASCQTIDLNNKRGCDLTYHGMYSSGTESYMLDETSVVFYTVDAAYDGTDFETRDKMQRCMFHIGKDKIIQGRVYPDGRDGGEEGYAAQFRNIMQKIVTDCLGLPNLWTLKKGTSACEECEISVGTHYRDYKHCGDCTVSLLKVNGKVHNADRMVIGHNPICPRCGEEHNREENIVCSDNCGKDENELFCINCGDAVDPESNDLNVQCIDTGAWYCDEACANTCDVYYCEDDGLWHDACHYYRDRYDGLYYSTNDSDRVRFMYGWAEYCYHTAEHAWADGWRLCERCKRWVREDNYNAERTLCHECTGEASV